MKTCGVCNDINSTLNPGHLHIETVFIKEFLCLLRTLFGSVLWKFCSKQTVVSAGGFDSWSVQIFRSMSTRILQ